MRARGAERHRHRRARRRRRRRRHAPDHRGDQPRQGGRGPIVVAVNKIDRPNADVDKATVCRQWPNRASFPRSGAATRSSGRDLGAPGRRHRRTCSTRSCSSAEVEELRASPSEGRAGGRGARIEPRHRPGPGRHRARAATARLRVGDPLVAGRVLGSSPGAAQRSRRAGQPKPARPRRCRCSVCPRCHRSPATSSSVAQREDRRPCRRHPRALAAAVAGLGREAHALAGGAKLEDLFTRDPARRGRHAGN